MDIVFIFFDANSKEATQKDAFPHILASFPSGLVVYWTINNILTIAQQWVIMKQTKVKTN